MSVFGDAFAKLFPSPNQPQAAAPAPAQVSNNPQNNSPTPAPHSSGQTAPNGVVPAENADNKYKDIWTPPKPEETKDAPAGVAVDPKLILDAAGKVDFSKVVDQETLAKISAGGEDAVAALVTALNKTAQQTYGQSVVAANRMVAEAVNLAEARFASQVPALVKRQNAADSLFSENAAFKDPMVQPVVAAIQTQLAEKFPKATAQELNQMAKEVMVRTADIFKPTVNPTQTEAGQRAMKDEDWETWFAMDQKQQ